MATRLEEKGARIHFLRPRVRRSDGNCIHFVLRIDNYQHILRAYGPEVARSALGELNRILADFFRDDGLVTPESDGRLEVLLWNPALLGKLPIESACENWVHAFCAAIAMQPIACADERLHLALSGAWTRLEPTHSDAPDALASCALHALERIRFSGEAPDHSDAWVVHYRRDMAAAAEFFGAIDAKESIHGMAAMGSEEGAVPLCRGGRHVGLAWQPVRGVGNAAGILYHECLIRLIDSHGNSHPPDGLLESLERLGLVRALDQYIISAVITELEQNPGVMLAANISAHSAQSDGWWRDIERRLAADRSVAQRLVIEITETAAMPSISAASAFVTRMRSLGCMIALDDFGTGFASIRLLLTLKPDIAKVDRLFIARAGQSRRDRAAFTHLVGLAEALVPIVIVEGIETDEQCRIALEAGAMWQQGYHHGRPGLIRSWRCSPDGVGSASGLAQQSQPLSGTRRP